MEWDPSQFFRSGDVSTYALLVLNQPINENAFGVLCDHASYIICADGGANRLYEMMKQHGKESTILPDRIVGDLDSLNPTIRQHYEKLNVPIDEDPDQYSTDFTKCLKYLNSHAADIIASSPRSQQQQQKSTTETRRQQQTLEIVILGGLGGRVDQAFSQIHHLYMMTQTQRELRESKKATTTTTTSQSDSGSHIQNDSDKLKKKLGSDSDSDSAAGGNLYLVSEESITFVLQKGKNIIHTPATNRPLQGQGDGIENGDASRKRKRENDTRDALPLPPPPASTSTSTSTSTFSAAAAAATDGATESDTETAVEYLFEENIGIIPLSASASITTTGFEWDVENWHTEIGGQLSTSNHIRSDIVSVETNVPVLFTVELSERLKRRMKG
ncbi:hypothetical protein PENSTE_c009G04598 [Penicillium steckii]|uniref:Thiamin pyrophosphokinase thiamin-binding domain-containing protein n=1 Tax=Penicillium steckii TaxID=303698 RepID=A0A1V6TA44_9EURO|nr:hypothetical protein PENSTE_c009G04598 [Penicillium steckii]